MSRRQKSLERFMETNRIPAARVDIPGLCQAFQREMTRGLEGRSSTLPMIHLYRDFSGAAAR